MTPCGTTSVLQLQACIDGLQAPWNGIKVNNAIQHLGVWLGMGAEECFWVDAAAKFALSARTLSSMQLPWSTTALWYGIAVQSQLAYLWSFMAPPPKVQQQERLITSSIMNIPHQSIPLSSFQTARAIGLQTTIRDMGRSSIAARCRVYLKSDVFPRVMDELATLENSDDVIEIAPHRAWKDQSAIKAITDAFNFIHQIAPILPDKSAPNLQKSLYKMLQPNDDSAASRTTLTKRMATMYNQDINGEQIGQLSSRLIEVSRGLPDLLGPSTMLGTLLEDMAVHSTAHGVDVLKETDSNTTLSACLC